MPEPVLSRVTPSGSRCYPRLIGDHDVVTAFVHPPIPDRRFDWCAVLDGDEEANRCGWGMTEQAAIAELRDLFESGFFE